MSKSDGTFILVATYPDELTARDDYESVKDLTWATILDLWLMRLVDLQIL